MERTIELHRRSTLLMCAVCVLVVACVSLLATTLVFSQRPKVSYLNTLESVYQRNFYDLADNMQELEIKLSKLTVADDELLARELSDGIWRQTGEITVYLAALPIDHHAIEQTYKLVNQLGDYIYALNKKLSEGSAMTAEEAQSLATLSEHARSVNESIRALMRELPQFRFTAHLDPDADNAACDALVNEGGAEYPSLIYDGPFSDALAEPDYSWLNTLPETDEQAAAAWVRERFEGEITYLGTTERAPRCHLVGVGDHYVQLTVQGLFPMTVTCPTQTVEPQLQMSEAVSKATEWAEQAFGIAFDPTWQIASDGVATVNLAPLDGGVTYYTELVKIKVELGEGGIVGVESLAYLSGRGAHESYTATRTVTEARAVLKSLPDGTYTRLALIPKGTKRILCREFSCVRDGYTYIAYVGANDLREYDLFRVIDTDQGEMLA